VECWRNGEKERRREGEKERWSVGLLEKMRNEMGKKINQGSYEQG